MQRIVDRVATVTLALLLVAPAAVGATICVDTGDLVVRQVRGVVVTQLATEDVVLLPGARVRVSRGNVNRETLSDHDGYFAFSGLPQGDYELHIELEGFVDATDDVKVRDRGPINKVLLVDLPIYVGECSGMELVPWKEAQELQTRRRRESRE